MENYKERDIQSTFSGASSTLFVNVGKSKDPIEVASAVNNFLITNIKKF
jgi:hypothetical protein